MLTTLGQHQRYSPEAVQFYVFGHNCKHRGFGHSHEAGLPGIKISIMFTLIKLRTIPAHPSNAGLKTDSGEPSSSTGY